MVVVDKLDHIAGCTAAVVVAFATFVAAAGEAPLDNLETYFVDFHMAENLS